ncbi:MAG: DnaJ C-terminal domain-containing protein, partial [Acidobacteriota bacterium]
AYSRLEEVTSAGEDDTTIRADILSLRRKIREGPQLKPGEVLAEGRFRLIEAVGKGGFATVFKAFDRHYHQPVAIKVLHGQYSQDRSRLERFFRGARKMAELHHQGIVRVLEPKLEDLGFHYFVMEYIGGGDLYRAVADGRIAGMQGLEIIEQIAESLDFAHRSGVIHRDIKPANILLTAGGRPKLTDFDLVRALDSTGGTRTGHILGTFLYIAPETLERAKDAGIPADIYALAMTAAFVLHGRDLPSTIFRDPGGFFATLDCPQAIKDVLTRATNWDPKTRQASVREFVRELIDATHTQKPDRTDEIPGADIECDLWLSFEQAALGCTVEITVSRKETCTHCQGRDRNSPPLRCRDCNRTGQVRTSQGFFRVKKECTTCNGKGWILTDPCKECNGDGRIEVERTLEVTVPAGVGEGLRLRLRGEGDHGQYGGASGNLEIIIHVDPHPWWDRVEDDVHARASLPYLELVEGTTIDVDTLHGRKKLEVPAGTQPGTELRLKNLGIQAVNGSQRGDHVVQIELEFPDQTNS